MFPLNILCSTVRNARVIPRIIPCACDLVCARLERGFHTSQQCKGFDKYSLKRNKAEFRKQARTVERVFKRPPTVAVFELDPLSKENAPIVQTSVRQDSLSTVILDAVNSMMMSPDVDEELTQLVEIVQVEMSRGLRTATVYWSAEEGSEEKVEKLIRENEEKMRRIFPAHHQMTRSPYIQFKRDKKQEYISKVNKLLSIADYGAYYIPKGQEVMFPHDLKQMERDIFITNEKKTEESLQFEDDSYDTPSRAKFNDSDIEK